MLAHLRVAALVVSEVLEHLDDLIPAMRSRSLAPPHERLVAVRVAGKRRRIFGMHGQLPQQNLHQDSDVIGVQQALAAADGQATSEHLQCSQRPLVQAAVDDLKQHLAEHLPASVQHRRAEQLGPALAAPGVHSQGDLDEVIGAIRQSHEQIQVCHHDVRKIGQDESIRTQLDQEEYRIAAEIRLCALRQSFDFGESLVCKLSPHELEEDRDPYVVIFGRSSADEQRRDSYQ
mmetsp:Transcript_15461/g.42636  ORF Transcript_15461/g.42636 Transcript_15461/m.42636 type:complete len:232 (+) Transcript_15461:177-872(+)